MKRIIVIGASSGIGRELALQLVKEDNLVGITGRRSNLLEELKSQVPDKIYLAQIDNTEIDLLDTHLNKLKEQLGGLDMLILCSGSGNLNSELDFNIEKYTIDVNVTAFTKIAEWTIKCFENQGSGHFVAITSLAGMLGSGIAPSYNASKAYQINYLKGLRSKIAKARLPIYIIDIRPGFVDTAMAKGEGLFWVAPVDKAASQIIAAINRKRAVAYITKRWAIIGFALKLFNR